MYRRGLVEKSRENPAFQCSHTETNRRSDAYGRGRFMKMIIDIGHSATHGRRGRRIPSCVEGISVLMICREEEPREQGCRNALRHQWIPEKILWAHQF